MLRWFGPFASDERLLTKYAYASSGALNASQMFLGIRRLPDLPDGIHYFHPLERALYCIADHMSDEDGVRAWIVGKRSRI